ncbi:hypothetical protein QK290_10585 [Pseudarthrobacter sp. AL07]|uniref:hypothetical protein n=1 Tax=Pseudarthrobacter sp. AL07 TaxID=3042233 RepID=UPI002499E667|nr:hypothetical protein [Pseudarthrobacter sp. AL07]MDI3208942.1 hypothetical protein [Pseudarthrobacter sp. AL07]
MPRPPSADVLPAELLPSNNLFDSFTVPKNGRLGMDPAAAERQQTAEAARRTKFADWFARRGIKTRYADHDERFEEVLAASRAQQSKEDSRG